MHVKLGPPSSAEHVKKVLASKVGLGRKPRKRPGSDIDLTYQGEVLQWIQDGLARWSDRKKHLSMLNPPNPALRHEVEKGKREADSKIREYEAMLKKQVSFIERLEVFLEDARQHAALMEPDPE